MYPCSPASRDSAFDQTQKPNLSLKTFGTFVLLLLTALNVQSLAAQQKILTIGLFGDSTFASTYGWGPSFAEHFTDQAKVINYAKNGATLQSLSNRLDELLALKPDYVLIQFGHNDQKKVSVTPSTSIP